MGQEISINTFSSEAEMAAFQRDRETQEALRVQLMSGEERMVWLREHWDPLQEAANALFPETVKREVVVRHFETIEEKNAADREDELTFALSVAAQRERVGL